MAEIIGRVPALWLSSYPAVEDAVAVAKAVVAEDGPFVVVGLFDLGPKGDTIRAPYFLVSQRDLDQLQQLLKGGQK